jgi:hypothetical protein
MKTFQDGESNVGALIVVICELFPFRMLHLGQKTLKSPALFILVNRLKLA